ncbi:hypothetical protein J4430_02925 [Candidatus Woesearchaeota archaeon]|nr:hypothetical protein [Candidatus Woesearchaeota archaeon]
MPKKPSRKPRQTLQKRQQSEYKVKSVIIGKKSSSETRPTHPYFISLFDINNPHLTGECPKKILEFGNIGKVQIRRLEVECLLPSHDLIINNLRRVKFKEIKDILHVSGMQKK